jgi:hypothetical protein
MCAISVQATPSNGIHVSPIFHLSQTVSITTRFQQITPPNRFDRSAEVGKTRKLLSLNILLSHLATSPVAFHPGFPSGIILSPVVFLAILISVLIAPAILAPLFRRRSIWVTASATGTESEMTQHSDQSEIPSDTFRSAENDVTVQRQRASSSSFDYEIAESDCSL